MPLLFSFPYATCVTVEVTVILGSKREVQQHLPGPRKALLGASLRHKLEHDPELSYFQDVLRAKQTVANGVCAGWASLRPTGLHSCRPLKI